MSLPTASLPPPPARSRKVPALGERGTVLRHAGRGGAPAAGVEAAGVTNATVLEPGGGCHSASTAVQPPRGGGADRAASSASAAATSRRVRARLALRQVLHRRRLRRHRSGRRRQRDVRTAHRSPARDAVGKRILSAAAQIGPLGRNLMFTARDRPRVPFRIVGVVADVHQAPIGQAAEPVIYHVHRQFPFRSDDHRRARRGRGDRQRRTAPGASRDRPGACR